MFKKVLLTFVMAAVLISCEQKAENGLISLKTEKLPVMDGKSEEVWDNAPGFTVGVHVPPYSGFDPVYHKKEYQVTMKSLYTEEDIFFLYSWTGDEEASYKRESWYFNTTEARWMQKPKKKSDAYFPPEYEDKFAVIWNINNSIKDFNDTGCLVLCHGDFKHTNSEGELGDTWHWKLDRTGPVHQLDDKWLTFSDGNGRVSDEGTGAYKTNKQELTDAAGESVSVPLYWIPGEEDYHWILKDDPRAKKIVLINEDNDLVDEEGNSIPRDVNIPSLYNITPATGSRGDVTVYHSYEEGVWTLEVKRKRSTGYKDDIDFGDDKGLYFFSIAVFDAAAIAHAVPGVKGDSYQLILK